MTSRAEERTNDNKNQSITHYFNADNENTQGEKWFQARLGMKKSESKNLCSFSISSAILVKIMTKDINPYLQMN